MPRLLFFLHSRCRLPAIKATMVELELPFPSPYRTPRTEGERRANERWVEERLGRRWPRGGAAAMERSVCASRIAARAAPPPPPGSPPATPPPSTTSSRSVKFPSSSPEPSWDRTHFVSSHRRQVKVWLGENADHYYVLSRFLLSRMLTVTKVPLRIPSPSPQFSPTLCRVLFQFRPRTGDLTGARGAMPSYFSCHLQIQATLCFQHPRVVLFLL
jgi:hypothetical protein